MTPRKAVRLAHIRQDDLRDEILACVACPLSETRTQAVPGGFGRYPATVVIVGEAPGASEDKAGAPFVGASGKKLDRMLERAGTSRESVAIINGVCCRPPRNRKPDPDELRACAGFFDRQLELSGAWVGLLLGATALKRIRPISHPISQARGIPFWMSGRVWVPTFHPAYGLRDPRKLPMIQSDISLAVDIATGKIDYPRVELATVEQWDSNENRSQMAARLEKNGWVVVHSHRLGATILYVRDAKVKIPRKHISLPVYTIDELVRLGEISRRSPANKDIMQSVHLFKTVLEGEVVYG